MNRGIKQIYTTVVLLVLVATPAPGQDMASISGITEPIGDVTLSTTEAGIISTILKKEGMTVKKGDIVLKLDDQLETFEVERRHIIWKNKEELRAATEKVATLKKILTATKALFDDTGSVSRETVEKTELEYALARADRQRLKINEDRERIEYEMALENLRKRHIISPIQGMVIKLYLQEGESCQENQPLVHVVDTSRCRFVCNVEEQVGRNLVVGQTVDLDIKTGLETVGRTGVIVFVSPVVDPASGLLEVKTEFDNADGSVRPGISGMMNLN